MRPRRKILLFCCDEELRGITAFTLKTKVSAPPDFSVRYAITGMAHQDEVSWIQPEEFRAAVVIRTEAAHDTACAAAEILSGIGIPTLFIDKYKGTAKSLNVALYFDADVSAMEWIDRLYTLTKRKRGPRFKKRDSSVLPQRAMVQA